MRNRYILLADACVIPIMAAAAFALRFDWRFYAERLEFTGYMVAALVIKPVVFYFFGMYQRYWRYASIPDLMALVLSSAVALVAMGVYVSVWALTDPLYQFSRAVLLIDGILTLLAAGGVRLSARIAAESRERMAALPGTSQRVLIVGAGLAGTMVAREMRRNPQLGMEPIGFLDDAPDKVGKHISGIRVLGVTNALPEVTRANRIESVVIAMPTARGPVVRAILDMCRETSVKSQTIPGVFELLNGQVSVSRLRNVEIDDLLRRSPLDGRGEAARLVNGRVVLITGGGGSIGFELARQIANAGPSHLVLLGHGENSIFEAEATLRASFPTLRLSTVIADVRDDRRLASVFDRFRPHIVFHAAAHKHVPLMEENPEEAVTNNVLGTLNVVRQATRTDTERLVLISTDKAVSPTSVMGATKRIAEAIVRDAARRSRRAFVTVRFGNVLGSRGSVVGTFQSQIKQGGPITVTHQDMTRFFMTIPEAVHLVLQASGMGSGGELFVLDMGEPVKIVQLARDLIKLSGLSEDDVPIVFTGVRPGEKLEEVLFDADTRVVPTSKPEIRQVIGRDPLAGVDLDTAVKRLELAARGGNREELRQLLDQLARGSVVDDALAAPLIADLEVALRIDA